MNICNILSISIILALILLFTIDCSCDVEDNNLASTIVSISIDVYTFSGLIKYGYIPRSIADSYSKATELDTISVTDIRNHLKAWYSRLHDSPVVNELFHDIIFSFLSRDDIWNNFESFQMPWNSLFPWIRLLVIQTFGRDTELKYFEQRIYTFSVLIKTINSEDFSYRSKTGKAKVDILEFISGNLQHINLGNENSITLFVEDYLRNTNADVISSNLKIAIQKLTDNLNSYIEKACESRIESGKLVLTWDSLGHISVYRSSFIFRNLQKFNLDLKIIYDPSLLRLLISKDDISRILVKNRLKKHSIIRSNIHLALCSLSRLSTRPNAQIISLGFFTIVTAAIMINYLNIIDIQRRIFIIPSLYAVITIRSLTIRHIITHKDRLPDLLLQMIPYLPLAKCMVSKAFVFFNFLSIFTVLSHLPCIIIDSYDPSNTFNIVMIMIINSIFIKILFDYVSIYIILLLLYIMPLLNLLLSIYCFKILK